MGKAITFQSDPNKQARETRRGWEIRYKDRMGHKGWGKWVPYPGIGKPKGLKGDEDCNR